MSTIVNLGYDKILELEGANNTPSFSKDLYNKGWKYKASNLSDLSELVLYTKSDSVPLKTKHMRNKFIKLKLNSVSYTDIPMIQIKTVPKGDGSDYDPLYHDSFTIKVDDTGRFQSESEIYFYYQSFPSELEGQQSFPMFEISSEGTHDPSLDILQILLLTSRSPTTDYNIIEFNYRNVEHTHKDYLYTFGEVNEGSNQIKINESLESIKINSDSMLTLTTANNKILEEENKNGYAQIILGSTGCTAILADSSIVPTTDSENRQGLKFYNSTAGTKYNLYFFGGLQETIQQSNLGSIYCKLYIDVKTAVSCVPFLVVYTKPRFDGSDAQPWYNSRWTYTINLLTQHIGIGEEVVLYAIGTPTKKFTNRLIQLDNVIIDGTGLDGEVLYLVLGSDSGATVNTISHTINLLGFNTNIASNIANNSLQRNIFRELNLVSNLINQPISRQYHVNIVNNSRVLASANIGEVIDMNLNKTINIYGSGIANHNLHIFQSSDNINFYHYDELTPTAPDTTYHFYTTITNSLRYIKLVNDNHNNTFTLYYTIL